MIRCGIALAGANRASQLTNAVAEDGILTGLEASQLHLQGTENDPLTPTLSPSDGAREFSRATPNKATSRLAKA